MQAAKYGRKGVFANESIGNQRWQFFAEVPAARHGEVEGEVMAKGLCERIGIDGVLTHKPQAEDKSDEKFNV